MNREQSTRGFFSKSDSWQIKHFGHFENGFGLPFNSLLDAAFPGSIYLEEKILCIFAEGAPRCRRYAGSHTRAVEMHLLD